MNILNKILWWIFAVLATVLTLGIWVRTHLVTVRMRTMGGVRAGAFGGTHLYHEAGHGSDFLVISTWHGKSRYPINRIAYASIGLLKVSVESSGGKTSKLSTCQTRTVAEFVNKQVAGAVA
jgi:hypothetical protein